MRAWALIAAATAEVSAVAGLATLRGVWMKEINGGTTVHLGLAASLHALLQVFGAALLPVIMLRSSFTTATRLFLFLHASFLLILASCVGTDLPSFYLTHALTGLVSCAAETLLNWTLLTSRDPNEQLEDFANFHKVYDVGTLLGAGVCATVFITYELWVYNMTGTGTANCSSQLGIRAVLGVHGIIMMLSFIGQFSAPVPSNCVAVRGYTYEDLMDALNLSKNLEEKAATEDEIEKTNEQEKRRVSLHAGMPILKVEDGKTIARHPTGRFQPQPTTSGVRPVADRTIFDRDNEDEYDYTDSYGEDDDSLDDNRYFSSSTDGLSQASVRSDPVSMGSSDHTSCHSSWTPRECAVNATKFDAGQERMHCPAAEVKQTPIFSNDAPVRSSPASAISERSKDACSLPLASSPVTEDVELVYDYSRDYTENNIPKTDTAEGVGPIEAGSEIKPSINTDASPVRSEGRLQRHELNHRPPIDRSRGSDEMSLSSLNQSPLSSSSSGYHSRSPSPVRASFSETQFLTPEKRQAAMTEVYEVPPRLPSKRGSVNFDHFATFFSPGASTELQGDHETDSKYQRTTRGVCPSVGKLSDRLDMKLKREKRNRLGPPVCFRRNGPSLVSGLTISKYGGLKQAPLEFKAHDEKRKERAEIRGGKDLHLFYYSFSANAHICFTTKEVTERVGNIWIERHMITIPQLDFLPLKSYNKEMLTDDALKSSVAVVRETRAAVRKGPESVLSTNALRVWPVFFSAAVFYITTLIYTLFLFHQMHVLESSAGLSSLVALGCFVVSFLLSSSSRISFRHSSQGHAVYYIMGSIFQIGVLFAMGFTTDRATVVTLMLICCGGAGMSMPAGVKAGTKMVPVMMQLQQFDSQLCSAHIVRILSPTITGCLYHWDRTAPFIVSGTIMAVSFTVTSTTFWLRPRAWAFDVSTVTEECGRRLSASPTKTADGLEDASETSPKNLAPEPRVGAADANGDPAEVIHTKITRVQQAIKDLTDIGEKPAVLPGCVPDADEAADGEASPVLWGQIVKSLDGHASPLRAFSRQRASRT